MSVPLFVGGIDALCRLGLEVLGLAETGDFALLGPELERRGEADLPTKQACA
jgi:hypothetical protein